MAPRTFLPLGLLCILTGSICIIDAQGFDYKLAGTDWRGVCSSGARQTPINIRSVGGRGTPVALSLNYRTAPSFTLTSNGITVDIVPNLSTPNTLTYKGETFRLLQAHAHSVSEHTIDGVLYPFELHLVHESVRNPLTSANPRALVLGIFFRLTSTEINSTFLDSWLTVAPTTAGQSFTVNKNLDFLTIISPERRFSSSRAHYRRFYNYLGSLTTPACNEFVEWLVIDPKAGTMNTLSTNQWEQFMILTSTSSGSGGVPINNRPPQPLKNRPVTILTANI